MFLHSRRFSVWLVSFLTVLVIYFIYNRVSRTPSISTTSAVPAGTQLLTDSCDVNTITGRVGNVGVGTARNVRYTKLNSQKQVEREFGFEELLHQDGNDWEIEKPFYTVFGKQFKSTLTGDKARVTVEASGGQVVPKEGVLTGNVTIRISPTHKGDFSDAVIYLDDVSFAGDRSLFSTDGFVEIDSNEVQLKGEGLEVVFNGDNEQLEHLKIVKLKYLRLKRWSKQTMPSGATRENKASGKSRPESRTGKEYKCLLDGNVVIDTAQELLMADVVSISNFRMSNRTGAGSREELIEEEETRNVEHSTLNFERSTEEVTGDVNIICDGGILIVPMDLAVELKTEDRGRKAEERGQDARDTAEDRWQNAEDKRNGRTMLCGQEVNYNAATGEAIATGPTQVIFDVNNISREPVKPGKQAQGPAEVTIVSQKQASFQPALNRAAFAGDCKCTVTQKSQDANLLYLVTAENLEAVLKNKSSNGSALPDIERFIARDGEVRLASTKKIGERMLAGVEMKCMRMDYNTVSRNFDAVGPGLIKYDNSQTDEPQKGLGRFSLRRKCIALLRNFDSLEFDGQSNHLTADAKGGSLLGDYFPDSSAGDKVAVTASRVEADILDKPGGRTELGAVAAKGAITYEDKDVEISGDEFVYDAAAERIAVRGTPSYPCRFNGAEIDSVEGNAKTGKWNTKIKGPGAIR